TPNPTSNAELRHPPIQNAKPTPFKAMVGSKNSKPPTIKNQYVHLPQTIAETKSKLTLTHHFTDSVVGASFKPEQIGN
ncbi:hypothetical protein FCV25MIE_01884, partial [Fagus crenata]